MPRHWAWPHGWAAGALKSPSSTLNSNYWSKCAFEEKILSRKEVPSKAWHYHCWHPCPQQSVQEWLMPSPKHGMEECKSLRQKKQHFLAQGRSQD